jgi:hypothetical protein
MVMTDPQQSDREMLIRCLSNWRVGSTDLKARGYVGKFFRRRRIGLKIAAEVLGNHGTYTVSIDAGSEPTRSACSCYIGKHGGCHHVRALAQTFLDTPDSFVPRETRSRDQVRTLDDLALYLESTPLESLLAGLKAHGLSQKRAAELLGTSGRTLGNAVRGEDRNRPPAALGALKLACLYLLEWAEAEQKGGLRRSKKE